MCIRDRANIYLNEFDQEYLKRGVPCIRYADDIVLLAKSKRASERLLESSTKSVSYTHLDVYKRQLWDGMIDMYEKYGYYREGISRTFNSISKP